MDAYRVPMDKRNKCVNLYVQAIKCRNKNKVNSMIQLTKFYANHQMDNW